jgi:hypothetical protein
MGLSTLFLLSSRYFYRQGRNVLLLGPVDYWNTLRFCGNMFNDDWIFDRKLYLDYLTSSSHLVLLLGYDMTDDNLQVVKTLPIINILTLIATGMTKKDACVELGMPERTFDRYIREVPNVVADFIKGQREVLEAQYATIVTAHTQVVNLLVKQADKELELTDQLALESRLSSLKNALAMQLGLVQSSSDDGAAKYVKGLNLRKGKAKVTRTETVEFDIEGDAQHEIVDGELIDSDQPPL